MRSPAVLLALTFALTLPLRAQTQPLSPFTLPTNAGGGGDSPGGPDGTLQYRVNSTTLGGVTSSSVSGANVQFGGRVSYVAPTYPGLAAWYKADVGVTTSGTDVTTWVDQSGWGNNLSEATGSKQPDYPGATQNGIAGVQFDGVDDVLAATGVGIVNGGSLYVVFKPTTTPGDNERILSVYQSGGADFSSGVLLYASPTPRYGVIGSQIAATDTGTATGTAAVVLGVRWVNDLAGVATNANAAVYDSTTGHSNPIFATKFELSGAAGPMDVTVYEVLGYARPLNDVEDAAVRAYLNARWAVY